jgi:hypothetical protein
MRIEVVVDFLQSKFELLQLTKVKQFNVRARRASKTEDCHRYRLARVRT